MLNSCHFIGRLGKDPEKKVTGQGKTVCNFSIATLNGYGDEPPLWVDIVTWNKTAEACAAYLSKGKLVFVGGNLHKNEWEDKDGNKRFKYEIIANRVLFLDGKKQEETP